MFFKLCWLLSPKVLPKNKLLCGSCRLERWLNVEIGIEYQMIFVVVFKLFLWNSFLGTLKIKKSWVISLQNLHSDSFFLATIQNSTSITTFDNLSECHYAHIRRKYLKTNALSVHIGRVLIVLDMSKQTKNNFSLLYFTFWTMSKPFGPVQKNLDMSKTVKLEL